MSIKTFCLKSTSIKKFYNQSYLFESFQYYYQFYPKPHVNLLANAAYVPEKIFRRVPIVVGKLADQ